jgi:hypothetical protein
MRKFILLAGAAAMAAAMPAVAKEGKGQGGGKPDKQVERIHKEQSRAAERVQKDHRKALAQNSKEQSRAVERFQKDQRRAFERGSKEHAKAAQRLEKQQVKAAEQAAKQYRKNLERQAKVEERFRDVRVDRDVDRRFSRKREFNRNFFENGRARFVTPAVNGCPPGLAKKNALCLPPGQYRKAQLIGQQPQFRYGSYNIPARYQYRFRDDDRNFYRYDDDGYVYRIDRGTGLISSIVPLYSTGLMVGEPLPLGYSAYNVPVQYRDLYYDTDDYYYRYDDGAIYRANAQSGLVDGVVALLANQIGIGQPLPSGYDAYNVPLGYRDRYYDNDDYLYRYANGGIYQVDPTTRLVQALVELIV